MTAFIWVMAVAVGDHWLRRHVPGEIEMNKDVGDS